MLALSKSRLQAALQAVRPTRPVRFGGLAWQGITWTAAILTMLLLGGVAAFLVIYGAPALAGDASSLPAKAASVWHLVGPLLFGSAWVSVLALLFATPIGIGVALYTTMVAPRRLGSIMGGAIDILAAIPSVVFGLWGLTALAPPAARIYDWLSVHLGWIPLFAGTPSATGRTMLTAAVVLAIMVLPLIAALSRETIALVPTSSIEGALALGATRWQAITMVVLPQARSGIITGIFLALGRALGETMAVAMVLSPALLVSFRLITAQNPGTVAGFIALTFPEAHGLETSALLWLGLMLFALTLFVNSIARGVLAKRGVR